MLSPSCSWSKPQLAARAHPRSLAIQKALLSIFTAGPSTPVALVPITYADRARIRRPGDAKFALGPHMDGGSVERWEDPGYRSVYKKILEGDWEGYDAWQMSKCLYIVPADTQQIPVRLPFKTCTKAPGR